jgi:hypothetical protein
MCAFAKVDALLFWKKKSVKGNHRGQDQCSCAFRKLPWVGQPLPPIWLRIDHSAQVTEPPPNHTLNANITLVELLQALKKLQRNKVISLDGMKIEFILDMKKLLHIPLLTTFNCFMVKGFPKALSTWVVHAFFKGGGASEFENYKGITIGPILTKLFAMIFG